MLEHPLQVFATGRREAVVLDSLHRHHGAGHPPFMSLRVAVGGNYSGGCLSFWEERTTVEGAAKVIEDRQPLFAQGADIGSDPHMATGAV